MSPAPHRDRDSTVTGPLTLTLGAAGSADVALVGGKARSLGRLLEAGLPAPDGVVVTTAAYRAFVTSTGLAGRVGLELARKSAGEYRWEELWDTSLRVRTWFLTVPWPEALRAEIERALGELLGGMPVAVRSSSPHEDSANHSFAGMHESVVGAHGPDGVLEAVREVWASLYSDRALLYRGEIGLDAATSSMAVVVQPLASSERSGVAFTRDPSDPQRGVLEGVWGLGEGLVSGQVAPDRWTLDRTSGIVLTHTPPETRESSLALVNGAPALAPLSAEKADATPLATAEAQEVFSLAMSAEQVFSAAQDCEWTWDRGRLVLVQARPITTITPDGRDVFREWQPSLDRLMKLRVRIEDEVLPGMAADADRFAAVDLQEFSDRELEAEASERVGTVQRWRQVYRDELIPFAHGARLFGRFYVQVVRPDDPFEFVLLLVREPGELEKHRKLLADLGVDYPAEPAQSLPDDNRRDLQLGFLELAEAAGEYERAVELLDLGRASWRVRDDDNLYLERVEREAARLSQEIARRTGDAGVTPGRPDHDAEALASAASQLESLSAGAVDSGRATPVSPEEPVSTSGDRPRQLVGQPAGPGVATGPARVVRRREDLLALLPGEILVADALEPDTAALALRAAGIVERRGGMLVHGAIVAREHGLPCVTGVPRATELIRDGDVLTVDGYLGIVVFEEV